jgi:mannose-6-phosphate isomerase
VHPDSEQARAHGWGERGKTEAWYVVDAAADARIAIGFNRGGITREEVAEAAAAGRFESLLNYLPVRRGDAFFIPAGTVHAILGGILIYEVQEESNATLRLYDWNRKCPAGNLRKLHIADALDIINYSETRTLKPEPVVIDSGGAFVCEALCDSKKFTLCRYRFSKFGEAALSEIDGFRVVSVTDGLMSVRTGAHRAQLGLGQTILLPPLLKDTFIEGVAGSEALVTEGG